MRRLGPALVVLGLFLTACGGTSDEAEAILGTWVVPVGVVNAYETFRADGTWDVYEGDEPPHDWGTYTLEDGILTMTNADDSYCGSGGSAVFEVAFSEDGNELREEVVSESCSKQSLRGRDRVLTRHTP